MHTNIGIDRRSRASFSTLADANKFVNARGEDRNYMEPSHERAQLDKPGDTASAEGLSGGRG